jgi:hypothetical protein
VYIDLNPGIESVDYPIEIADRLNAEDLPIIKHSDGYIGFGCSKCLTDGFLHDNVPLQKKSKKTEP